MQTQNGVLQKDDNGYPVMGGTSSADDSTIINCAIDPVTRRLLTDAAGGGTVTSVSVVSANGFAGTVATATTTPAITLSTTITGILKGNGTAISAAVAGDFPTLNQNTTGSAATLTTTRTIWGQNFNGSANVTGDITLGVSSITMTGSIGATGARVTKLWATDIESTNMPTVSGTSLSSTFAPIASPTFTGTVTLPKVIQTVTAMGAQALDGSLGNVFTRTLAGSETFTQSNFSTGQCFMVEVTQGSGTSYTVTWFSGITWITTGGTAPVQTTVSNGKTVYGFRCTGTNTFIGMLMATN